MPGTLGLMLAGCNRSPVPLASSPEFCLLMTSWRSHYSIKSLSSWQKKVEVSWFSRQHVSWLWVQTWPHL